ncbi:MAG: enoyl-CoA hydratase-related protein [Pseudomonadota bacterium]
MDTTDDCVSWRIEDGIAFLVLNRPDHANAIGLTMARALANAIDSVLAARPRVIVLQGRGRVFCAGGDIAEFTAAADRLGDLVDAILDVLHPAFLRLCHAPVPVIAEVGGPIGGAGVGWALAADVVLASPAMKLRTGYAALGLSPDLGSSWFLARRAGPVRAQRLLMLSEPVDAQRCQEWGLVDELHAPDALAAATLQLARRLAASSQASIAAIKALCRGAGADGLEAHLAREHALLRACATGADGREGVAAFTQRRTPEFDRLPEPTP